MHAFLGPELWPQPSGLQEAWKRTLPAASLPLCLPSLTDAGGPERGGQGTVQSVHAELGWATGVFRGL